MKSCKHVLDVFLNESILICKGRFLVNDPNIDSLWNERAHQTPVKQEKKNGQQNESRFRYAVPSSLFTFFISLIIFKVHLFFFTEQKSWSFTEIKKLFISLWHYLYILSVVIKFELLYVPMPSFLLYSIGSLRCADNIL